MRFDAVPAALAIIASGWSSPGAKALAGEEPVWRIIKPSSTGIPGEQMQLMTFDPEGNLWVAARWPVWGEAGIAMLPAEEVPLHEWPLGGFDTGPWTTWSNVHHPIPSQFINDIEFSILEDGIIWLATGLLTNTPDDGGLVRFDTNAPNGSDQQWIVYDAANSPLNVNGVLSLDQDSEGNIWLTNVSNAGGAGPGAVFRFNPATDVWTEFNIGEELPWHEPWDDLGHVLVGADDHVWLTHQMLGGLAEYDGSTWTFHDSGHPGFAGMLEDLEGNIWLRPNVGSSGLWRWDGEAFATWDDLGGDDHITALGMDDSGLVYVGAWNGGIWRMVNGETPALFTNIGTIYPGSIKPHSSGDVWIASLGAVRHYNSAGEWQRGMSTYNTGLGWYFIHQIYSDPDGEMWFSSGENGSSRSDGERWRNFGRHNAGSEPWPFVDDEPIDGAFQDDQGNVYLAGNGIMRWRESDGAVTGFWDYPLVGSYGGDFAQTPDGRVWVGRITGVYWLNPQTDQWEHPIFSGGNTVEGMCVDRDGVLWVVTTTYVRRFDGQNWTHWNSQNAPIPPGTFSAIAAHPDGSVWMAHDRGLLRFDGVNWSHYTNANSGLFQNWITDVKIRGDGLMAVANVDYQNNVGGITLFDGTTWTTWTPNNSPLTHWQVEALEFDRDGNLWASPTSEGVVQIMLGEAASPAVLTRVQVLTGTLISGGLPELSASDDERVRTRSGFGQTLVDLHSMEMVVEAISEVADPSTIHLAVEARLDQPTGSARLRLFNWDSDQFESIGQGTLGQTDSITQIDNLDASRFASEAGEIRLSIKHVLFVPVFAFRFDSFVDHVEILAR